MKRPLSPGWLQGDIPFHPWPYFLLFLASNSLISFTPLPFLTKLWVGILGLGLPLAVGFYAASRKPGGKEQPSPFRREIFPVPPWMLLSSLGLLLFTRFYRLTSLPFWPISDEGIEGFLGMGQARHWQWRLLWTEVQHEPFLTWFLGVYFKLISPSLFSLRLLPALVSIATVLGAYWAGRKFFSKSFSFLLACLAAFSFWQFLFSRYCMHVVFLPLFQCLCLGWVGVYRKAGSKAQKGGALAALVLFSAAGFYVWTNWMAFWLLVGLWLVAEGFSNKGRDFLFPLVYGMAAFIAAMPLILARLAPGGLEHILQIHNAGDPRPLLQYLLEIFWDCRQGFPWGPNWGGLLNPLLVSFVFLGVLRLVETRAWKTLEVLGLGIFLAFLPPALTSDVELHRAILCVPFLMVLAAMGMEKMLESIHPLPLRAAMAAFLVLLSGSLDAYNYIGRYCSLQGIPASRQWRNIQYFNAYQIIQAISRQAGPLYVFSEFNTDYDNKTLDIADYPFNAAENPSLSTSRPHWVAVIANTQYFPYFARTFPGLSFKPLDTDDRGPGASTPFGIFLIPISRIPPSMLENWEKADEIYRAIDFDIKNRRPNQLWQTFLESRPALGESFPGDRFLTAVYWEKRAFFKFLDGYFIQATEAYRKAIQDGIPAAHLYYDLGVCLKVQGRPAEAEECFKEASSLSHENTE